MIALCRFAAAAVLCGAGVTTAPAASYTLPPPDVDIVGNTRVIFARYEDTLMELARSNQLGLDEILQANPELDRWLPGAGSPVTLPTRFILPEVERQGIVLNLAEKRLYYFSPSAPDTKPQVFTYPVGIGRMDWETPLGLTKITAKVAEPEWRPPESIKLEHLQRYNEQLPDVVPAGPDNPLGSHALRLGLPGYLIHGSNKRYGVGSRVSHGCVRMYNDDIAELFAKVPVGTPVRIVHQPIKIGRYAGSWFIEVHTPLPEDEAFTSAPLPTVDETLAQIYTRIGNRQRNIDYRRIATALAQASGVPTALFAD